jgi:probable O-glycosylation ligase (exosortase A-associated)
VETIGNYEQDRSATNRLTSWRVAYQLAKERPLLGGGFWAQQHAEIYERYGEVGRRSAHSIYFNVLGDHGFIALGLFVFLLFSCLWSLQRLRWTARRQPAIAWMVPYTLMLEASLVAYMIVGAFLTMAYFDLYYHLVSFVVLLKVLARRAMSGPAAPVAPAVSEALGRTRA